MSHGFARQGLTAPPLSGGGAWSRPDDWLALTTPDISEQKIVALHAVLPGSNYVAFTITAAFTVDWGDGTAPENFASGATAYRNLAWADYDSETLTSRGFRQAVITITPQAGQNITSWNFYVKHNQAGLASGYSTGWLDVRMSTPNVTAVTWGANGTDVVHRWVEQFVWVGANTITIFTSMFSAASSLQSVSLDTSLGTNFTSMFSAASSLQSVSLDTSLGTNFDSMFNGCSSLQSVSLDTSSGTNFTSMFNGCSSLQSASLDTSSGTIFNSMFNGCSSLQSAVLDTSLGTSFDSMFNSCSSLQSVSLDTSSGTNFTSMFNACSSLQSASLDTSSGTNFDSMFNACSSLQSAVLTGCKYTVSVASAVLGAAALDALYTSLGTAAGAQTITVAGNHGTTGDDPTIATAKGWTVTGS